MSFFAGGHRHWFGYPGQLPGLGYFIGIEPVPWIDGRSDLNGSPGKGQGHNQPVVVS